MNTKAIISTAFGIAAVAALSGCETLNGGYRRGGVSEQQQQMARAQAERQEREREQSFMRARVDETSASLDDISARLDRLERRSGENDAIRGEIDRLHDEIDALRADQQRMRKEIVDDLSAEITKAVAAATPARSRASQSSSASSGSGYEHIVEAGQTLSQIAAAYGTTVDRILKANNIKDANKVRVGQKLFIPD